MERKINTWIIRLLLPVFVLTCLIKFKVEWSVLKFDRLPYVEEIYMLYALILGAPAVIRSMYRWGAFSAVNRAAKGQTTLFYSKLSGEGKSWAILFHFIEFLFSLVFFGFFQWALDESVILSYVLLAMALEQLLFIGFGIRSFGVAITSNSLIISGRALDMIPLSNVRSVEMLHDDVHFLYSSGKTKQMDRRIIPSESQSAFASKLREVLEEQGTYVTSELYPATNGEVQISSE